MRAINQTNATADFIQSKEQLFEMFQQILNVSKFEHQVLRGFVLFASIIQHPPFFLSPDLDAYPFQIIFNALQLENPDEQVAAIRREIASREETLRELPKVSACFSLF